MAAISDLAIPDAWLPVGQFREYLHEKYCYADDIQFNTNGWKVSKRSCFQTKSWNPMCSGKKVIMVLATIYMSIKRRTKVDKDYIYGTENSEIAITTLLTYMKPSATIQSEFESFVLHE